MNLKNKIAIVTGASSGIGKATAELLTKEGVKVVLVARSKDKLKKLEKKLLDSYAVVCDMTQEKEIDIMIKKVKNHFGRIDILVNNAGQGYDAAVEKINIKTFRKIIDLNLIGPVIAMQKVIPLMRKQGGGRIINVSSGLALMSLPNMSGYSSIKRALVGVSLTAREELEKDNINVSVAYPYMTATDFEKNTIHEGKEEIWEDDGEGPPKPPDSAEYIAKKIVDGIISGEAKIFAHEWFKSLQ